MEEVKKKVAVSLSEVKELLKNQDPENMDQIQRWTFDYVSKVSTLEADSAKKMKQQLVKDCNITEEEAVELINIVLIQCLNYVHLLLAGKNLFSLKL